jgi:hypothetical protein
LSCLAEPLQSGRSTVCGRVARRSRRRRRLRNGQHVRVVHIDTPEVYFHAECYGPAASQNDEAVAPPGLSCVCSRNLRRSDRSVRAPSAIRPSRQWRSEREHRSSSRRRCSPPSSTEVDEADTRTASNCWLKRARRWKLGLWRACPHTPYDPSAAFKHGAKGSRQPGAGVSCCALVAIGPGPEPRRAQG